jgi:DNA primase
VIIYGREVDPLSLWGEMVDLPANASTEHEFLDLVFCPNPDHDNTRSPAFQINVHKPLVHCFANCGISGSYEHAIQIAKGVSAREARKLIFRHSRVSLGRKAPPPRAQQTAKIAAGDPIASDQAKLEAGAFTYLPQPACNFLAVRGITPAARGKWRIGWDEETKRIVLPVYDEYNRFRFLIRRALDNRRQKYLYTLGAHRNSLLYGACFLSRETIQSRGLVLVEGALDTIRIDSYGFPVLATLGSGLSLAQARIIDKLNPRRLYLMFDKDLAGVQNIFHAKRLIQNRPLFVCRYPRDKSDPAELTRKEAMRSIETAIPYATFQGKVAVELRRKVTSGKG